MSENQLSEILKIVDLERLSRIAQKIALVKKLRHGEVILVIKNGEIAFLDMRISEDLRKR
ncbi:MAG: hypothetical protein KatS3mg054_0643 [Chloroflexus sp.]|nr:MAG: hypothetical protein KatS3mg054_0643 [Chloroflexus sp.]